MAHTHLAIAARRCPLCFLEFLPRHSGFPSSSSSAGFRGARRLKILRVKLMHAGALTKPQFAHHVVGARAGEGCRNHELLGAVVIFRVPRSDLSASE